MYSTFLSSVCSLFSVEKVTRTKKTSEAGLEGIRSPPNSSMLHRKMSDPDIHHSLGLGILSNGKLIVRYLSLLHVCTYS